MSAEVFNKAIYLDDIPKEQWKNYFGNGYRSICYMTDEDKKGKIVLFGFDKEGNPKTFIAPHKSHVSYCVKYKTTEKDQYGRFIATKYFDSKAQRDKYVENANGLTIVECLKPEQEFANYFFDDVSLDPSFNKQKLRIHYLDIETEISDAFERAATARNRINMITIYDTFHEKFFTWSLDHADRKFVEDPLNSYPIEKFEFFEFHDSEESMLEHFLGWIEDNFADVVSGWNIKNYDIPYIVRRIENVLGKNAAKRLSPIGRYFLKEVNHENSRADATADIEASITGLFIADGLIFYRDKFKTGNVLDGGYSLDNVGEAEGCGNKIHYDGTLKDLYMQDYLKFYEYNVRDVDLCKRIIEKKKLITLARQVSSYGLADYNLIYGSINYLVSAVRSFAKTLMKGIIFTSYLKDKWNFDKFEGAFVFPTIQGVYRYGTGTIDFASLYPSCIRATNVSPETYVGKILIYFKDEFGNSVNYIEKKEKGKSYEIVGTWPCNVKNEVRFNPFSDEDSVWGTDPWGNPMRTLINAGDKTIAKLELMLPGDKVRKPITVDLLRKLINEKCIWTANNTLFLKHEIKWGVVAKWSEYFYNLRKSTKKKMLALEHKLHDPELTAKMTKELIEQDETDMENYNVALIALKNMINSIYGCLGTTFSPIANPHIALTVTRLGRFCNQNASKFILKYFLKNYNAPEDYPVTIGGDTDSVSGDTIIRIKT